MANKQTVATMQKQSHPLIPGKPGKRPQSSLTEERQRVRPSSRCAVVSNYPRNGTVEIQQGGPSISQRQIRRTIVKKQAAATRSSARLRDEPPLSFSPYPQPLQTSYTPPVCSLKPGRTKRKRLQENEPELPCPSKQSRRLPPKFELSKKNLGLLEEMDVAANNTRPGSIKRSSSRRSTTGASDTTLETTRTQRSSGTTAFYRFTHLATAQVYIHADLPKDVRDAIDAIIKAEPTKERRDQLKPISQALHDGCTEAARAAVGEDDFVRHFHTALKAMKPNNLCLREKADWQEVLKPKIQRSHINLDFLTDLTFIDGGQDQEVDHASTPRPPKRQQQSIGQAYISPNSSIVNPSYTLPAQGPPESDTMPPPAYFPFTEKDGDRSLIKTPRPDITIGTNFMALTSTLSSQNLNSTEAQLFLTQLSNQMVLREPGGPTEPALISIPASRASDLVFPFAVVEGKAYSTGKQVFEAENQAAVSGACGLKIQLCLDELVKRATPISSKDKISASSDSQSTPPQLQPALFFSICTEGPIHELWVHWTIVEDSVRKFNMKLLKLCHGVLLEGVEDFIVAVDNVLCWGTGHFMGSVVSRLGKVARKAA